MFNKRDDFYLLLGGGKSSPGPNSVLTFDETSDKMFSHPESVSSSEKEGKRSLLRAFGRRGKAMGHRWFGKYKLRGDVVVISISRVC